MSVMYVLTEQEKLWLMDKPTASLDRIMNMVHCGEYDFKNVIITNLTKKYAYKYDKSAKNFTKVDKTILLDAIVSGRVADLEEIYKEFVEQKKLTYKKQVEFKQHLDKLLDDDIAVYDNKRNIKLQDVQYVQGERRQRVVIQNRYKIMKDITIINPGTGGRRRRKKKRKKKRKKRKRKRKEGKRKMKMKMKGGGDIMVFESPMNPTSVLYYLYYYLLSYTLYTITESTPNLTALRAAVGGSRAPLDRASCITHHIHLLLYTRIIPRSQSEILETGDFRVKTPFLRVDMRVNYGRRSKPRTSCVFSWVFRAQTFGLILSYIINKLFKIENTKEPIRAFPPADPI
jgi:hypothetical protein